MSEPIALPAPFSGPFSQSLNKFHGNDIPRALCATHGRLLRIPPPCFRRAGGWAYLETISQVCTFN